MRVKFQYLPSALAIFLYWSGRSTTLTIPPSQSVANPSISQNLTIEPNVHCTEAETWRSPFFHDLPYYLQSCTRAFEVLQRDLRSYAPYAVYEFVDRRVEPMTTMPTIRLPKIYNSGKRALCRSYSSSLLTPKSSERQTPLHLRSCTIAIAMIGSLSPGDQLPGDPTGPFRLSATATIQQILDDAYWILSHCVRSGDPALGWSQAGDIATTRIMANAI